MADVDTNGSGQIESSSKIAVKTAYDIIGVLHQHIPFSARGRAHSDLVRWLLANNVELVPVDTAIFDGGHPMSFSQPAVDSAGLTLGQQNEIMAEASRKHRLTEPNIDRGHPGSFTDPTHPMGFDQQWDLAVAQRKEGAK